MPSAFRTAATVGALAYVVAAAPNPYVWKPAPKPRDVWRPAVSSEELQASISGDALYEHEAQLQSFAYAYPDRNRLMGSQAHNDTVTYVYNTLTALDYYDVTLQPWSSIVQSSGEASLAIDDAAVDSATLMDYSPSGNVTAPLVAVSNQGCDTSDYPADVSGNIALISRGTCEFGLKSVYAGLAGAVGAIIYNNIDGDLQGTLGTPREEGPYVPTVGIPQALGLSLIDEIEAGDAPVGDIYTNTTIETVDTFNVLAQTKGGDQNNTLILSGHSDSVAAGPGINDDGSGSTGILEVAIQLANYTTTNSVRFAWWSGEEEGLLGSTYYVENLPAAELAKLRLMLDFDMIASPNYIYAVYDGDGSSFNISGPAGSAEAEALFEDYYTARGVNYTATAFDGRSDYGPFLDAGVASGGVFTGAEGIKTEAEAEAFGGEAGVAYDVNYHGAGDTLDNLDMTAFVLNTQAIAHAVATYATSFDSLNQDAAVARRGVEWRKPVLEGRDAPRVTRSKRNAFVSKKTGKLFG
ncbi:Glycoside hydrolase family 47 [Neofusicoccum parvum]|uniref:Peptide hydrolase n=2 Tax=Neofusicoccum parvum TaxID=310453 RepID=R1EX46_BOTPV|nr:putative aminopeptidase y protein [Neofusicoccum parvum UCRNP2]GME27810.1 Glycoside hydrolase family 47 [Neofusicoccum parvum]GME60977.1 Glycoside hydrolase family 47 [Neofusicoccum parvum]